MVYTKKLEKRVAHAHKDRIKIDHFLVHRNPTSVWRTSRAFGHPRSRRKPRTRLHRGADRSGVTLWRRASVASEKKGVFGCDHRFGFLGIEDLDSRNVGELDVEPGLIGIDLVQIEPSSPSDFFRTVEDWPVFAFCPLKTPLHGAIYENTIFTFEKAPIVYFSFPQPSSRWSGCPTGILSRNGDMDRAGLRVHGVNDKNGQRGRPAPLERSPTELYINEENAWTIAFKEDSSNPLSPPGPLPR
uniref:Uncharacterized protein n=1 Tax=Steinernema glaseri TaxID=37863 RepID=A0A1I8AKZ3_9BILA